MSDPRSSLGASPLDYATPAPVRHVSVSRLIVCLAATALIGVGSGFIAFGSMVAGRMREQVATLIAIGVMLVIMGIGVIISWFVARTR